MRIRNTSSPITNGVLLLAVAAGFAFIGGLITNWLFYSGLVMSISFVVLWAINYKFNLFMEGRIKLLKYIYYDFKNQPVDYITTTFIWCVIGFWGISDYTQYREIGTDVLLAILLMYLISCVMVFWGYFKDYDRLP